MAALFFALWLDQFGLSWDQPAVLSWSFTDLGKLSAGEFSGDYEVHRASDAGF